MRTRICDNWKWSGAYDILNVFMKTEGKRIKGAFMEIMLKIRPGEEPRRIIRNGPAALEELAEEFAAELPYTVMLAKVNGKYEELTFVPEEDSEVELLDIRNHSADLAYQNSLCLLYLKSVMDVMGKVTVRIDNSLNKGLYTEIDSDQPVTETQVEQIENRMRELAAEDIAIVREVYQREDAIEIWEEYNYMEKGRLLREKEDIREAKFYSIEGYRNFFYGLMVPSTGYLKYFRLEKYRDGVLLRFPQPSRPDEMPENIDDSKIYEAFKEAKQWHRLLDLEYLADLNERMRGNSWKELVLLSEALHEKKIAEIADRITSENKRIILIAGPSSSGKTTFARRLCVQLRVNGLKPLYMGIDDYYLDRCDSPVDEDGNYNFENLDSIDVELFNNNMNGLLAGETVDLPEFDFMKGEKVFGKRLTSIEADQPIVIEGIHGLNGQLTEKIDDRQKFRIYISPFTQLNIDIHNRVTTTDARMIRRIVRDYEFRGSSAAETIALWPKVRAGEDRNIFPYNGQADVMFNSALAYELAVLGKYAVPVLEEVQPDQPEYAEAVRLLKFIRYFEFMDDDGAVPNNSIIREFIGGSIFAE